MDRKGIITIGAAMLLLLLLPKLANFIFPPIPAPQTNEVTAITLGGSATNRVETISSASALTNPAVPTTVPPTPAGPERTETLESDDLRVTITSHGGGLKSIELKGYQATVDCRNGRAADTNRLASLNAGAPRPVMSLAGPAELVGDGVYALRRDRGGIRAEKILPSGLRLIKIFHVSTNHLLTALIRIENGTNQPLAIPGHEIIAGTSTPMTLQDESLTMGMEWYDGDSAEKINDAWFKNYTLGCIPGRPRAEFRRGSSNVVWTAIHNQFFALIAVPAEKAPQVVGRSVPLPPPSEEAAAASQRSVLRNPVGQEAALAYPQTVLAPGAALEREYSLYAGPKEYYSLSRQPNNLDKVMGFDGWFGPFAKGLLLSMNGLHGFGFSYGLAIIVITVIIKLLFWPLTNASTRSMKRMAELQPQMKALQEKYKDDPKKMNQKLMEFMKENKVSPLGGCLPMLLQIPVFIGFYQMLQSAIELRGAKFLWVCDLSQSDTIAVLPLLGFPINPMPILMGATMFFQARLTPVSPGMDPMQQKIMKYMPLMFVVFLYNFSAGLALYWTVSNLLSIAQMKLTKTNPPQPAPPPGKGPAGAVRIVHPKKRPA